VANRLASATSPYLLQHAQNPVDWWEWSPEAFEEARRRDLPVLLSVGYAACHWCHVILCTLRIWLRSTKSLVSSAISRHIGSVSIA